MDIIIDKKVSNRTNEIHLKYSISFNTRVSNFRIDINKKSRRQSRIDFRGIRFQGKITFSHPDNSSPINLNLICNPINRNQQLIAYVKLEYGRKTVYNQSLIADPSIGFVVFSIENIDLEKKHSIRNQSTLLRIAQLEKYVHRKIIKNKKELLLKKIVTPKIEPAGKIIVFYGTNRKKTGNKKANTFYGNEIGNIEYGSCEINIPKGHAQGKLERPKKIFGYSLSENRVKHIVLDKIEEITETNFYKWLQVEFKKTDVKSGLLFVHGYNTTFAEAAMRTGQIAYDIPFNNGISGFFSWPSSGKIFPYLEDEAKANASICDLEKFIEDFVLKTGVEKLHIIAHSMGNLVVTAALNNLAKNKSFGKKISTLNQIVLAAPDLDQEVFKKTILPTFKTVGTKRTLYASDQDKALGASNFIRNDRPRLGQAGKNIYVDIGIDTIDASNVISVGNHHSYIFETKEVLTDLFLLFDQGCEPINRRLREVKKEKLSYWLFRE